MNELGREFEQMELQFFVKPGTDDHWFEYWRAERLAWFSSLGMKPEKLRWHRHEPGSLAHYAKDAYDIEYQFPFGWGEIEGIHNRTDDDLSRHEEFSGKSLKAQDESSKERFTPYVIETSAGASRSFMAFLIDAYHEDQPPTGEGTVETRVVLRLHPKLAPLKIAIFPLVNRDGMPEFARAIEKRYLELGGQIHYGMQVERILVENDRAVGVRLYNNDEVRAGG